MAVSVDTGRMGNASDERHASMDGSVVDAPPNTVTGTWIPASSPRKKLLRKLSTPEVCLPVAACSLFGICPENLNGNLPDAIAPVANCLIPVSHQDCTRWSKSTASRTFSPLARLDPLVIPKAPTLQSRRPRAWCRHGCSMPCRRHHVQTARSFIQPLELYKQIMSL